MFGNLIPEFKGLHVRFPCSRNRHSQSIKGKRRDQRNDFLVEILSVTIYQKYNQKVDVSYYSGGRLNHSKIYVFFDFSTKILLLIATSHPKSADHGVGLNFTPTLYIYDL